MFSKLKRFLSVSLCLIFYIFLFAGNFGGNSVCSAAESSTIKKYVPIDLSGNFNRDAIWGTGDDWDTQFKNNVDNTTSDDYKDAYKVDYHGVDGYAAFYTTNSGRNYGIGGLPTDGKVSVGNIPFHLNTSGDNDCLRLGWGNEKIFQKEINLKMNDTTNITNITNLYILGITAGKSPNGTSPPTQFWYTVSSDSSQGSKTESNLYNYFANPSTWENDINNDTNIVGYTQNYHVRTCSRGVYRPNENLQDKPNMQCCKLNTEGLTWDNNNKLTIEYHTANGDDAYGKGQFLVIFAVTAEVEYDNNITLSDIKHDSFKIECGTEGSKQVKISTTKGLNSESMTTAVFPYTPEAYEGTTYYCTIYDDTKKAYYYFEVMTKKSLKLVAQIPSGLVYNGAAQQLVTGCSTLNANDAARPESENTLLKANIYLRIKNATGTPTRDTEWCNLNSLANLTAINAGTYNIYYYIDEDNLGDYELINEPSTVTITVTNTVTIG